jgi:hypothetical protein
VTVVTAIGGTRRTGSRRGRPRVSCLVTAAGDRCGLGMGGDMGVAALISWLVTAFFGLDLLAVWLIEYDVTGEGAPASRLPTPVILGHVLFALTGVVFWVIHLLLHASTQGWAAVGILAVIAALGLTMFTRWIPVHRAFAAAESGPR